MPQLSSPGGGAIGSRAGSHFERDQAGAAGCWWVRVCAGGVALRGDRGDLGGGRAEPLALRQTEIAAGAGRARRPSEPSLLPAARAGRYVERRSDSWFGVWRSPVNAPALGSPTRHPPTPAVLLNQPLRSGSHPLTPAPTRPNVTQNVTPFACPRIIATIATCARGKSVAKCSLSGLVCP
jgi:hypothetical protein